MACIPSTKIYAIFYQLQKVLSDNVTNLFFVLKRRFIYFLLSDNELPAITDCPPDKVRDTLPMQNFTYVTWNEPSAMDNDGIASFSVDLVNGSVFTVGNTTVTYTAVDLSGNEATCSFLVTVEGKIS